MSLYSTSYLKGLSANKTTYTRDRIAAESKNIHTTFDIFLSHSYLDKDVVEGIYIELINKGFTVYVDWIIDPQLSRANVTKETAELVRKRMQSSRSLLLAFSSNATLSKWIPWELGFVDGKTNRCALLPVSPENEITFTRSEYLLLYPYLKRAMINYNEQPFITESAYSYAPFADWVQRDIKPYYHSNNIDIL